MKKDPVLIIGGVAAGTSAAAYLKRLKPEMDVILADQASVIGWGVCEIPHVLSGQIGQPDDLLFFPGNRFETEKGVKVFTGAKVTSVNLSEKTACLTFPDFGHVRSVTWSKLVLATGSSAKIPENLQAENVFALKTFRSLHSLLSFLSGSVVRNASVIGAGPAGIEISAALAMRGINVTLIEKSPQILPDKLCCEDSSAVSDLLFKNGISVLTGVQSVFPEKNSEGRITRLITGSGQIETDLVISATGFQPNTDLPGLEKLKKHSSGAWIVNSRMETTGKDVLAAGDCAFVSFSGGREDHWTPLASRSSKMGRQAALTLAGKKGEFLPENLIWGIQIFHQDIVQTGLTYHQLAAKWGADAGTIRVDAPSRVKLLPGTETLALRLNFHKKTWRIYGASLIGPAGSGLRLNVLSLAIQKKMTLSDLENASFLYTPDLSPLWDPVILAAREAQKLH